MSMILEFCSFLPSNMVPNKLLVLNSLHCVSIRNFFWTLLLFKDRQLFVSENGGTSLSLLTSEFYVPNHLLTPLVNCKPSWFLMTVGLYSRVLLLTYYLLNASLIVLLALLSSWNHLQIIVSWASKSCFIIDMIDDFEILSEENSEEVPLSDDLPWNNWQNSGVYRFWCP
jgi:hypothetical protein